MYDVVVLFESSGYTVKPWADNGFKVLCVDLENEDRVDGNVTYLSLDLSLPEVEESLIEKTRGARIVIGYPPCTDLARSGARHWDTKRKKDPLFQKKAIDLARLIERIANCIDAAWILENPAGALSTMWKRPNLYVHPYEFGGYIPEDEAVHPIYPDLLAPRDSYKKKTGFWFGNGFIFPDKKPVEVGSYYKEDYPKQFWKTGGTRKKTKHVRSLTPRGIAIAFYEANKVLFNA